MSRGTPIHMARTASVYLYHDAYVEILADPDGRVVRIIRTAVSHPSPQVLEDSYLQGSLAMDRFGRNGRGLLVDVRSAIGRNGPEYDDALRRARERNDAGFARIAVLLRSQTGMLQMMRLSDEDGTVRLITMSEPDALAYLRYGTVPTEVRPGTGRHEKTR